MMPDQHGEDNLVLTITSKKKYGKGNYTAIRNWAMGSIPVGSLDTVYSLSGGVWVSLSPAKHFRLSQAGLGGLGLLIPAFATETKRGLLRASSVYLLH